ncbi:MAG: hypothetical protein GC160_06725 [Acidobacteria bacterium]|nr:hypothetical protein [Acidobacteriota bacterium]
MRPDDHYWPVPGVLAAGRWPRAQDLDWLEAIGVSTIINLTERPYEDERFEVIHMPVPEFMAPELEQVEQLCRLIAAADQTGAVYYVHCHAGCGRTGAMAACVLVHRDGLSARQAIDHVRGLRPCSIESDEQEDGVTAWEQYLAESG